MKKFNRLTIVAAAEVVLDFRTNSQMDLVDTQWNIVGLCDASGKTGRAAKLARIALEEERQVLAEDGQISLQRALIDLALEAPERTRSLPCWRRLVSGLRMDGFEIVETEIESDPDHRWQRPQVQIVLKLIPMLPSDVPGLDFREAENEVTKLLRRHGFTVAEGHLKSAMSSFGRGEWTSANGEMRKFLESYLNEMAESLGYAGDGDGKSKRDFLGNGASPPFLLAEYNEWSSNNNKAQYVQGLMSRMHPHGGHPGLSEEEDATFRMQINLVTARLFLRRFDQRQS